MGLVLSEDRGIPGKLKAKVDYSLLIFSFYQTIDMFVFYQECLKEYERKGAEHPEIKTS